VLSPGMKVAVKVPGAESNLALGIVQKDGQSIVWHEIVDLSDGSTSSKYGMGFRFGHTPKPIKGDEVPCPPQLAHLLPDPPATEDG
jgi:hypothetical protein